MPTMNKRERVIDENTRLGIGFLVAEAEEGTYLPIAPVSTISEAREMAANDLRRRMRSLDQRGDPLCPARYRVWAQGDTGEYATVAEIEAD